jgi:hypothetical protein
MILITRQSRAIDKNNLFYTQSVYDIYYVYLCIFLKIMRKNIDIDETTLTKLKLLSVFENNSVKRLMEEAVTWFVAQKEKQRFEKMTKEEKEDLGLLLLMQQSDRTDVVDRDDIMNILDKK